MKRKKAKNLEKEIEEIDKELKLKKKENDELQHLLIKRINQDVKAISKLINPLVKTISNLTNRIEALEGDTVDKKIDETVDDMFR